jgi:ATP-dependent Zn protease
MLYYPYMSKINKKLIMLLGILAFLFGLFMSSTASAYYSYTNNGPVYAPDNAYNSQYIAPPVLPSAPLVTPTKTNNTNSNSNQSTQNTPTTSNTSNKTKTVARTTNNTSTVRNTTNTDTENSNYNYESNASDVNESYGSLTANALLGSNTVMPSGLVQWIFLILLVVAIIFLWRYVHRSEEQYMASPMKHA